MNKKITVICCGALMFSVTIFSSCKKELNTTKEEMVESNYVINFVPAKTTNELITLRNNSKANIIRTLKDFNDVLALKNTPLSKLSTKILEDFKSHIVFRDGVGVVGFKFGTLRQALSYDDFAMTLSIFGLDVKQGYWGFSKDPVIVSKLSLTKTDGYVGSFLPVADHPGYLCSLTLSHTCAKAEDHICLSGC